MKKIIIMLVVLAFVFSFSACSDTDAKNENLSSGSTESAEENSSSATVENTTEKTVENTTEATTITETAMQTTDANTELLPLEGDSMQFYFLSGAGGWRTVLTLNSDGTFKGEYHDSEMGSRADDYPNGTAYVCSFSGKFSDFVRLNDNSYNMKLEYVNTEKQNGEEWIENGVRYIASVPHGIYGGTEFVLYLPATPVSSVSDEFLSWWPFRYTQQTEPRDTLSCYGIFNVAEEFGFFSEV